MTQQGVYMVIKHWPNFGYAMTRNKAQALREAKKLTKETGGIYEVRTYPVQAYGSAMDYPTYYALSDRIYGESLVDRQADAVWQLQHGS